MKVYVKLPNKKVVAWSVAKHWPKLTDGTQHAKLDKRFGRMGWMQWSFCKLAPG